MRTPPSNHHSPSRPPADYGFASRAGHVTRSILQLGHVPGIGADGIWGGKDTGLAPPFWRSAGGRSASLRSKYHHRGPAQARIQNPVLRRALTYLFAHFATHKG